MSVCVSDVGCVNGIVDDVAGSDDYGSALDRCSQLYCVSLTGLMHREVDGYFMEIS